MPNLRTKFPKVPSDRKAGDCCRLSRWPAFDPLQRRRTPHRTFDKIRQVDQGAIADNKRLGPILAMIRNEQLRRGPQRRSMRAPRRRDQRDARLFKFG
jgi:hypothetical protein